MGTQRLQDRLLRWRDEWPVRRTMLYGGLIGYGVTLVSIRLPLWCAAFLLLPLLFCLLLPRLRRPHLLLGCAVAVLFWGASIGYQITCVTPRLALDGQTDTLHGWVEATSHTHFYTVRVTNAEYVPAGSRVLLYCPDVCAPTQHEAIVTTVNLAAVDRDRASYWADGIFLTAFPSNGGENGVAIHGQAADLPWLTRVQALRRDLSRVLRHHLPGDEGAMLAALCLGEQQTLSPSAQTAFRESGLAHVLVVSGLHLSMVVLAVESLLCQCRLSRRLASLFTIPVLLLFVLLIGLTPSVVRAGIMCLLWLGGRVLRRRASGLNSLGLAAIILLLSNPYVAADPGFLLSFAATAGVLCLVPRLLRQPSRYEPRLGARMRDSLLRKTNSLLTTSVCASLFIIPLLCYYFGGFSLITPISNLLAVPAATCAMLTGWAGILIGCIPAASFLGKPILLFAGLAARLSARLAEWCSGFSGRIAVTTQWQFLLVCGCAVLLITGYFLRPKRLRKYALLLCALVVGAACGVNAIMQQHNVSVSTVAAGDGTVVLLRDGTHADLLVTHSDSLDQAVSLLKDGGCTRLDTLFVGNVDPAHVATLCRLLRQAPAARVVCADTTGWPVGTAITPTVLSFRQPWRTPAALWTAVTITDWQVTVGDTTYYLYPADGVPTLAVEDTPLHLHLKKGTAQP